MSGAVMVLSTGKLALAASILPTGLSGSRIGSGTVLTSATAVVTVVGGTPPYTYLWTRVSGDAEVGPINGTSSSTRFSAYFPTAGNVFAADYKCVVTDAAAASVDSNTVPVEMESFT